MYRTTPDIQKRKDEKKQAILDAAAAALCAKGYHGTTVKDIVGGAAVSVGTFYFYFKGKEDLYRQLYDSIVGEFTDRTLGVVDTGRFSMLKNYTRVMAATLWMYEQKREIARIMLLETAANPVFQRMEARRMREFARTMAAWFHRFKAHDGVYIPDEEVAALIYAGSYSCLIGALGASQAGVALTGYGYAFCVYHLQALGIPFEENEVRQYIGEVLDELNQSKGRA